nr:unnamed protein product [Digitaria exilis]
MNPVLRSVASRVRRPAVAPVRCVSSEARTAQPPRCDFDADKIKPDFSDQIRRSIPHLRALLHSITVSSGAPLAALIMDFFCYKALPLAAAELGVPGYIFCPTNVAFLALLRCHMALNDGSAAAGGEYRDLPDPLQLSDHLSLRRADMPAWFQDCTKPDFELLIDMGHHYRAAAGFLVNSFNEMENASAEEEEIKPAAEQDDVLPPAYMVGPLVRIGGSDEDGGAAAAACLEWLDHQPECSVVYVSFGSGGLLSVEQMAELAAGLEGSGHRFLWVVRMPSLQGPDGMEMESNNGHDKQDDPFSWLPDGFMARTSGRGLVVAAWAPQVRVLSHPATAAFVSHCGWNSAQESMAAGVPMIAWPMYAEQRMNAVILSDTVGVALRLRERPVDGLVPREEIAAAVRELMEEEKKGRAMRGRARDVQEAAVKAWAPEGSSRRKLEQLAGEWKATALGRQKH